MPGIYTSLDLLALPSLNEATPMCLLEALAAECPVVATRVGSVERVVSPERTGVLVRAGDAEELAAGILRSLGDPVWAHATAVAGREQVRSYFSADVTASAYAALYEEAVAHHVRRTEVN
jgi:glycosyltransferase involved in cell wall biosynthesis